MPEGSPQTEHDLVVVGSGPGGTAAALAAARRGLRVAIVERGAVGGVCLNVGCIPTKALVSVAHLWRRIENAGRMGIQIQSPPVLDWPEVMARNSRIVSTLRTGLTDLLKREGVDLIEGTAHFENAHTLVVDQPNGSLRLLPKRLVLAVGAKPISGPWTLDEKRVLSYRGMLERRKRPDSLLIVGGGVIGCEFASIFAAFGTRVTILEQQDQILPSEDPEIVRWLIRRLETSGVEILTSTAIQRLEPLAEGVEAQLSNDTSVRAEAVLVAIGYQPNLEALNLAAAGIQTDRGIVVDQALRTHAAHIAAIGDCLNGRGLAHWASAEGHLAVQNLLDGSAQPLAAHLVPRCVYTDPEIASIGRPTLPAEGIRVTRLSFGAIGKSVCDDETDGVVKLAVETATDSIVGASIIGNGASALIHPLVLAMHHGLTAKQLARTITAHPSLPEAVTETAAHVYGASLCASGRTAGRPSRASAP